MNVKLKYSFFLEQLKFNNSVDIKHQLLPNQSTVIGRESSCQIILDSEQNPKVSRRHIEIRPLASLAPDGSPLWQACDLGSANGAYINKQRLQGCQTLNSGDRISLGKNGTEFIFKCQKTRSQSPVVDPINTPLGNFLPLGHIIPIITTKQDLLKKGFLIPGVLTVLFVVGLSSSIGLPGVFNASLALFLAGGSYYFVYRLCGKHKPWWLICSSAIATILILMSPMFPLFIYIFREVLPGNTEQSRDIGFIPLLISMFFGAGLMEELLKAIPVFTALWIGTKLKSPLREKIGVWEPLDGILLGAASAVGFTLLETLGQYVPNQVQGSGELAGLQILILRIVGSIAVHLSYSGYFGYFIGLSMLRPSRRWSILGIGYITSSALHALWNASGALNILVHAIAGILAYVFLVGAILKARQLSPTRSQNFATQFIPPNNP